MVAASALDKELAVLGVHAARTVSQPGAVALWRLRNGTWRCLRVAPSCVSFSGRLDWSGDMAGGPVDVASLLQTCRGLLGGELPAVAAASTPLAQPGRRRRALTAQRLRRDFRAAGFQLVTAPGARPSRSLIEADPHIALMALTAGSRPVQYKASSTQTYWPGLSGATRFQLLVQQWRSILWRLGKHASGIEVPLPRSPEHWNFSRLKRFENAINALACAWMAAQFLAGALRRIGDDAAAIWVPTPALRASSATARIAKWTAEPHFSATRTPRTR